MKERGQTCSKGENDDGNERCPLSYLLHEHKQQNKDEIQNQTDQRDALERLGGAVPTCKHQQQFVICIVP